ncbi:MAG: class I SAM-dependent methyltransferase [Acidimicrobiales bacterium]
MSIVVPLHARAVFGRRVRVLAAQLAALIPPDAQVLDVGCGDGSIALATNALRPDVEISGIDVLVRATAKMTVTSFDGRSIPFNDGSYDAVILVDVLHHADDATRLIQEAARVARRTVLIKDHLADGFLARPILRFMDWVGNAGHGVPLPYNYWRDDQWSDAFAAARLEPRVRVESLNLYPWPFSAVFDRRLHALWCLDVGGPLGDVRSSEEYEVADDAKRAEGPSDDDEALGQ